MNARSMPEAGSVEEAPSRREIAILCAIALAGCVLRSIQLGTLSFGGDEETTTLAALALLEGWPPTLPGGLVYLRGLPFTVLESLMIHLAGVSEGSLRVVPVLVAAPRIAAAWWLARCYFAPTTSLGVAALVAVAPFDVEISRVARMYSLFATLDLLFVASTVRLALGRSHWLGASAWGVLSMATHALTVMHAPIALLGAMARGVPRPRWMQLLVVTGIVLAAFVAHEELVINHAYAEMGAEEVDEPEPTPLAAQPFALAAAVSGAGTGVLAALGALAALGLAGWATVAFTRIPARLAAAATGLAFALGSPVLGGVGWLATLMLEGVAPLRPGPGGVRLAGAGLVATAGWALVAVVGALAAGSGVSGAVESAVRLLLALPAPNWFEFALASPVLFVLAVAGAVVAAQRAASDPHSARWLMLVAAALGPMLLTGLIQRAEALRFQILELAPMILLAVVAVEAGARRLVERPERAGALAVALVFLALLPHQTLRAVTRPHGPVAEPFAFQNVAPDHRSAGHFVREHAEPGDWIAAEDSLQQYLYAGRAELWLRSLKDGDGFSARDPETGDLREVYTGARLVGDLAALPEAAAPTARVVWLITSGEVEVEPQWYRTPETDEMLRKWRPLAHYVGEDGLTRVYRLVDGEPEPPAP